MTGRDPWQGQSSNMHGLVQFWTFGFSRLAEQLVHTGVPLGILLEYLCNRHFEIFLPDILPSLTECIHS
jgi:hypothetical protein